MESQLFCENIPCLFELGIEAHCSFPSDTKRGKQIKLSINFVDSLTPQQLICEIWTINYLRQVLKNANKSIYSFLLNFIGPLQSNHLLFILSPCQENLFGKTFNILHYTILLDTIVSAFRITNNRVNHFSKKNILKSLQQIFPLSLILT